MAAYPPGYSAQPAVVINPPIIQQSVFRHVPVRMRCQFCNAEITTSTSFETGALTWIIAGVLLLFGLWLGCCLIPFCIDGCKDVVHTCPSCQQVVGKFNRM